MAVSRRQFLAQASLATLATSLALPSRSARAVSPNDRLRIASVGTGGQAVANLNAVAGEQIVALADIDARFLEAAAGRHPQARTYRDFREMLQREADNVDAVLVSTADHTHAPAAAMALRLGKHVYCEKPLSHTVYESRKLAELARERGLVTQLGTQIHAGDNYRRVVELIESGAIGPVREVHVWAAVNYSGARFRPAPQPEHVDWDLWLGPAPERPYSERVHPFQWRRFWDYGTGGLGDLGCHFIDLAHWALKLRHPTRVEVVEGPEVDPVSAPPWVVVRYEYPARENLPPVELNWYDGGRRPPLLDALRDRQGRPLEFPSGQLFVGQTGMLVSDYGRHLLLPEDEFDDYQRPEPYIDRSIGHHREWLEAIRGGGTTSCNFDYSGALTEAVLLGTVAYRSGEPLEWDAAALRVTNSQSAQQLIHKPYRDGWTL